MKIYTLTMALQVIIASVSLYITHRFVYKPKHIDFYQIYNKKFLSEIYFIHDLFNGDCLNLKFNYNVSVLCVLLL